jgi:hypothetical protein
LISPVVEKKRIVVEVLDMTPECHNSSVLEAAFTGLAYVIGRRSELVDCD